MKINKIEVTENGVTIFGASVGLTPTIRDFRATFEGKELRVCETAIPLREKIVCDEKGLSWLTDLETGSVLWFKIYLEPNYRQRAAEAGSLKFFSGKIQIGRYTVQGPFSFQTGEILRKVVVPGLGIRLSPGEKTVRAITIAFRENERQLRIGNPFQRVFRKSFR
ncbi:MAG TPA: hypothetical protein VGY98_07710 [Verrucomicrobiae bacterium]|nr:hypothetical protein [Verrucomicrobiae bacterium]